LKTRQLDFVNAFVQASMPAGEDVYVGLPPGIHLEGHDRDSTVLKLDKSLYGMTRSPLLWFLTLRKSLHALGYEQSQHDQCMFINRSRRAIVLVYCDDCLCFAHDDAEIDSLIAGLREQNLILDEQSIADNVYAYLGIEVNMHGDVVELKQVGLIDKILRAVDMDGPTVTPNDVPAKERPLGKELDASPFAETWNYSSVIGMLLYLENTRPDIQFAVNQCARFMQHPRAPHARAVKKICRYLKGTRDKGLCFKATPSDPTKPLRVDCFVDASFAPCWDVEDPMDPDSAKSRSSWIIKLDDCPIAFASRKQGEAALSTVEAEYLALSMAMRELLWIRRIVQDVADGLQLAYNPTSVVHSTVWEDNQGCIAVAHRPDLTARTRHIVTKYHHFKDNIRVDESGNGIEIAYCPSAEMEADIMTKGVKRELFLPLRDKLMGWHLQRNHVGLIGELKNTVGNANSRSEKSIETREVLSSSNVGDLVGVKCDSCGSRKCV
jgi:histone deacetylase 1/2